MLKWLLLQLGYQYPQGGEVSKIQTNSREHQLCYRPPLQLNLKKWFQIWKKETWWTWSSSVPLLPPSHAWGVRSPTTSIQQRQVVVEEHFPLSTPMVMLLLSRLGSPTTNLATDNWSRASKVMLITLFLLTLVSEIMVLMPFVPIWDVLFHGTRPKTSSCVLAMDLNTTKKARSSEDQPH